MTTEEGTLITDKIISDWEASGLPNQSRMVCPSCGPDRKKSHEKTLSVTLDNDSAVYFCHHCEARGSASLSIDPIEPPSVEPESVSSVFTDSQREWLESRGISEGTASRCGVKSGEVYISKRKKDVRAIGFHYKNPDGTQGTKWRDGGKNFTQTGRCFGLWRADQFKGGT